MSPDDTPWVDSFHESVRPTGFHPVSTGYLVMGLFFLNVVVIWGLFTVGVVTNDDLGWLVPLPFVIAGAVGVLIALTAHRRPRRQR